MKKIHRVRTHGSVVYFEHCKSALADDGLTTVDADNVLRCGRMTEPAEPVFGRWRYRVHTDRMCVVVQFESEHEIALVTAWRKKT